MISVVVPVYNEEEIIPLLHDAVVRAMSKLRDTWEVVYVNDGSTDSTLQLLRNLQLTDTQVVVVDLSRNWGHMGAISAGLQTAGGDAVVLMDGDLQDPPDVVPEMVEAWRRGAQVVTAVRRTRQERRKVLALLFPLFYRVLGALADFPIPLNAGIFGLLGPSGGGLDQCSVGREPVSARPASGPSARWSPPSACRRGRSRRPAASPGAVDAELDPGRLDVVDPAVQHDPGHRVDGEVVAQRRAGAGDAGEVDRRARCARTAAARTR